jgi:hypothetical protein
MSNRFIYVVDAHFIDYIEGKKILDPSACGKDYPVTTKNTGKYDSIGDTKEKSMCTHKTS